MLIDSHCHLDFPQLAADEAGVLARARTAGVGGMLTIGTRLDQQSGRPFAEITVTDNGPGFASDIISQVFDPYVTSKPKGTGLGLAIVKKIVEEHGGWIEAENRRTGGARVRVTLPLNERTRAHAARDPRKNELRRERA